MKYTYNFIAQYKTQLVSLSHNHILKNVQLNSAQKQMYLNSKFSKTNPTRKKCWEVHLKNSNGIPSSMIHSWSTFYIIHFLTFNSFFMELLSNFCTLHTPSDYIDNL